MLDEEKPLEDERRKQKLTCILLDKSRINDVVNTVNSERGFRNIRREDDLSSPWRSRVENSGLHLGGEGGVDGENEEIGNVGA